MKPSVQWHMIDDGHTQSDMGGDMDTKQRAHETVEAIFKDAPWLSKMREGTSMFDMDSGAFRSLPCKQALDAISRCNAIWMSTTEAIIWAILASDVDAKRASAGYMKLRENLQKGQVLGRKKLWRSGQLCTKRLVDHNCWGIERNDFEEKVVRGPLLRRIWEDGVLPASRQRERGEGDILPKAENGNGSVSTSATRAAESPGKTARAGRYGVTKKHGAYHVIVPAEDIVGEAYFLVMSPGANPRIQGLYRTEAAADRAAASLNRAEAADKGNGLFQVFMVPVLSANRRRSW